MKMIGGKNKLRMIQMKNETFTNLMFFVLFVALLTGAGIGMYNEIQTNINAQIEAKVNFEVQEATERLKMEYKGNRVLYRVVYTSSFEQQEFYFQTNGNPFEVAKNYLPDEWTGLKIEEVTKIENSAD
jgi:hypothetical protein